MRIGVDIRCLMEPRYSGISEYTVNLLRHLVDLDHENQYIFFYNESKKTKPPVFQNSNVTIKGYKYPNKFFNLAIKFLKVAAIDKMIGGVDVFISPNFLFTNISKKCRQIIIVHDLSFEIFPQFFTLKKRLWHRLINPKKLCEQADKIVAISKHTANDLVDIYNIPAEKITTLYPGVHENFFKSPGQFELDRVKEKYNLPKQYLFSISNIEPRKNIESLLLAMDKIKHQDAHLILAGDMAWKSGPISKLAANLVRKNRVKFLGYVDANDKPALYALASAFIYPSIYEGFGLPPVEAMAVGTPVISSFSSSLPEAVGNAGILIDPHNLAELAHTIDRVLDSENLQKDLRKAGKQRSEIFHWQDKAEKFKDLINSLK